MARPLEDGEVTAAQISAQAITADKLAAECITTSNAYGRGLLEWLKDLRQRRRPIRLDDNVPVPLWLLLLILLSGFVQLGAIAAILLSG